ncbi:hypothetical protein GWI33_001612 [Rhynchophorus ferrugineus]|uniref:Uncharacterized protein n=1 Tax=Rhynchophorus ferrugineus TaxID=354439 RepID=A0A834INA9_RHYFE|nr:hypothetical protein GWI33_001612 [Rhynchophorus ferrugineus]
MRTKKKSFKLLVKQSESKAKAETSQELKEQTPDTETIRLFAQVQPVKVPRMLSGLQRAFVLFNRLLMKIKKQLDGDALVVVKSVRRQSGTAAPKGAAPS